MKKENKMKNKITLKEFFESKEELAIHCDTKEKVNKLLKEFDKFGKKWRNGESYLDYKRYGFFEHKICYSNRGLCDDIEYYKGRNYKIYSFEDVIFEEEKPKNLIPEIAKMLGIEIGEEFKIKGWSSYPYKFDGVLLSQTNGNEWEHATADDYEYILTGKCVIEKLPKKPQLTDAERAILQNLPKKYKWVARDADKELLMSEAKLRKRIDGASTWDSDSLRYYFDIFNHLFQFIKWEDDNAYKIEELLKGE